MREILVVVGTLALCFGADKLFTKYFRSQPEHRTGLSVRLSKMYGAFGLILAVIGIAALISGVTDTWLLVAGGIGVIILGVCMVVYYMSFGIYYGEDTFLVTTFGKRTTAYQYKEIRGQQLYLIQGGNVVVELHMTDGRTVQLQSTMNGVYPFLDHAYTAWLRQTGRREEDCGFHDPANSCWFPSVGEEG